MSKISSEWETLRRKVLNATDEVEYMYWLKKALDFVCKHPTYKSKYLELWNE